MSTIDNNLFKSKISKINREKTINIICKDPEGNTVFVKNIKYKEKISKPKDIKEIVEKDKKIKLDRYFIDYDNSTKAKYIVSKAKRHKKIINWDIDFDNISINDVFETTNSNSVNIVLVEVIGEFGGAVGANIVNELLYTVIISFVIKLIKKICSVITIKFNPYKNFIKNNELFYKEEFIKKVICLEETWPEGFITNKNIDNKKCIEKTIMKKLGYIKQQKKWIRGINYHYKYPDECLD